MDTLIKDLLAEYLTTQNLSREAVDKYNTAKQALIQKIIAKGDMGVLRIDINEKRLKYQYNV